MHTYVLFTFLVCFNRLWGKDFRKKKTKTCFPSPEISQSLRIISQFTQNNAGTQMYVLFIIKHIENLMCEVFGKATHLYCHNSDSGQDAINHLLFTISVLMAFEKQLSNKQACFLKPSLVQVIVLTGKWFDPANELRPLCHICFLNHLSSIKDFYFGDVCFSQ